MKFKFCTYILLFISICSYAQVADYNYERSLDGVIDDWHKITVPDDVFVNVEPSLKDVRIYGITEKNDTLEVPYILKVNSEKFKNVNRSFKIINKTKSEKGYYYTFQLDKEASISYVQLSFNDQNFDWKVNLEGSQDQKEWFTILEDYRILDIKNSSTDYNFTKLDFPDASYKYFRVLVKSNQQPDLKSATITKRQRTEGVVKTHRIKTMKRKDDKSSNYSFIDFELENKVPVHRMQINVNADYDYYRQIRIEYLADSVHTEKGWRYDYRLVDSGVLSSLEKNEFEFNVIAQKFRISVFNGDNQPLNVESVTVKGYAYELIARFTEPANYNMVYGNTGARQANYDIANFKKNIPKDLKSLQLGQQKQIEKKEVTGISALFENEIWLWAIMGIIILILGGFTYKMVNNTVK